MGNTPWRERRGLVGHVLPRQLKTRRFKFGELSVGHQTIASMGLNAKSKTSNTTSQAWSLRQTGSGCSNYDSIQISGSVQDTVGKCGELCRQTPDCVGFAYQAR